MFLLARPPLMRWLAATGLVLAAIWIDLRPPAVDQHPFLLVEVSVGDIIETTMVEMRPVVAGSFPEVELPLTASRPLAAGDPLTGTSVQSPRPEVPDGWLIVELAAPTGTRAGAKVVVVIAGSEASPRLVSGIVIETGIAGDFGDHLASCAFAPEEAALVAVAVTEQRASVLVGG